MERPTSGRRHIRAGSITVAELIRNRPTPVRAPSRDEATEAVTVTTPSGAATEPMPAVRPSAEAGSGHHPPNTHRRRAAHSGQLAKLAGLGVATVVLCGSIAAASIINTRRQAGTEAAGRAVTGMSETSGMSGEQTLLPNMFTLTAGDTPRITTELPAPNKGSASATVDNRGASHRPGDAGKKQPAGPRTTGAAPVDTGQTGTGQADAVPTDAELVREYYKRLARQPREAVALLDGLLRRTDLTRFLDSWSQTRDIRVVDVQPRDDGALLAIVEMVLPDGGTARVQQLLRVTDGQPKRITGAEIVSAQRS